MEVAMLVVDPEIITDPLSSRRMRIIDRGLSPIVSNVVNGTCMFVVDPEMKDPLSRRMRELLSCLGTSDNKHICTKNRLYSRGTLNKCLEGRSNRVVMNK